MGRKDDQRNTNPTGKRSALLKVRITHPFCAHFLPCISFLLSLSLTPPFISFYFHFLSFPLFLFSPSRHSYIPPLPLLATYLPLPLGLLLCLLLLIFYSLSLPPLSSKPPQFLRNISPNCSHSSLAAVLLPSVSFAYFPTTPLPPIPAASSPSLFFFSFSFTPLFS